MRRTGWFAIGTLGVTTAFTLACMGDASKVAGQAGAMLDAAALAQDSEAWESNLKSISDAYMAALEGNVSTDDVQRGLDSVGSARAIATKHAELLGPALPMIKDYELALKSIKIQEFQVDSRTRTDSPFVLQSTDAVVFKITGGQWTVAGDSLDSWPFQPGIGHPEYSPGLQDWRTCRDVPYGAMIGMIGQKCLHADGLVTGLDGPFSLTINDGYPKNNQGIVTARVTFIGKMLDPERMESHIADLDAASLAFKRRIEGT